MMKTGPAHYSCLAVMLLLVALFAVTARGDQQTTSSLQQLPWTRAWQAANLPIEITLDDQPQEVILTLPRIDHRAGQVACLRFGARLNTKRAGGWGYYLALALNNNPIGPSTPAHLPRLLNRAESLTTSQEKSRTLPFFNDNPAQPALLTFATPDLTNLDIRILTGRKEGAWYLLDIEDLLKTGEANTLRLTNLALDRYWKGNVPPDLRLVIEGLEIGYLPVDRADALRTAHLSGRMVMSGPTIRQGDTALTITPGGGLHIQRNGDNYFLETSFSYAGKAGIGFNEWRFETGVTGESGWLVRTNRRDEQTLEISAEGSAYRLQRRVTLTSRRIEVADTITNITDHPIGMLMHHELLIPGYPRFLRLAGTDAPLVAERRMPENPTGFIAQEQTAMGMVIEDSTLRLQMGGEMASNVLRFHYNHLGLPARAVRTLRWALYPLTLATPQHPSADDYFTFINAVRMDWKVNQTLQGPFEFASASQLLGPEKDATLNELLTRKRAKIIALGPWFEYAAGTRLTRDQCKTQLQQAMKAIKAVNPGVLCVGKLEMNLAAVPLSFFGESLDAKLPYGRTANNAGFGTPPGSYNLPAPAAMGKKLRESPWNDSLMRDAKGNILLDTYLVDAYAGDMLHLKVYPVIGNYWHQQLTDKIRFLLDEVGMDGIYFDGFSFAYGLDDRFTYDRWDNWTVDISAKTGTIIRRYADLGLLTARARIDLAKSVLQRGKIAVATTEPATMEEQALPILRCMETQGYDPLKGAIPDQPRAAKGQLASPIGLGHQWTPEAKATGAPFFTRTVTAQLHYGTLYYYYSPQFPTDDAKTGGAYGPVPSMFPLTPVTLGDGYLIGKERIVTTVSRTFDWPQAKEPTIRFFDDHGRPLTPTTDQLTITRTGDTWRVTIHLRDWWETAVVD
ncbi:MAG: hypothetical protein ACYDBB_06490 [Armatimonadota bacterium]